MAFGAPPGGLPGYAPATAGSFAGGNARTPSVAPGSYPPGQAPAYTPPQQPAQPQPQPQAQANYGSAPAGYGAPPQGYPPPQQAYGQPPPQQQQPYAPTPQPAMQPAGGPAPAKSKKGLLIAAGGIVVVAGATIAIVLATRGGGGPSGGVDSKDELTKQTLAAMAKGDVDGLLALAGPEDLETQVTDCKKRDDGEPDDPKKEREKLREKFTKLATPAKDLKLDLVKVDEKDRETKDKGAKLSERCTMKQTVAFVKLEAQVKVKQADKPAAEQTVSLRAVDLDGRWYLMRPPEIKAGADCDAAAAHAVELGRSKIKSAGMSDSAIGRLEKQMAQHCADDVWPDDAVECLTAATSDEDSDRCIQKLSNSQRDKLMAAMSELIAQEMKNSAPPAPTPTPTPVPVIDAAVGDPLPPEEPSGTSATASASGLPAVCTEYKAQIDKLQSCSKLPPDTRKAMVDSYGIIVKTWNDSKTKTAELGDSLGQACKSGLDAVIELRKLCR